MIHLERTLTVKSFDVEGTVAVGRSKPEFLSVARLAADLGHSLNGSDVSRELLGGLPDQVGWRAIERCIALGLLERLEPKGPAALSNIGSLALERGEVLVPEEGTWRIYYVNDPLVDEPIVHVQRFDVPRANDERNDLYTSKREQRERPQGGTTPPQVVLNLSGKRELLTSLVDDNSFEILEVGKEGLAGSEGSIGLTLDWDEGAPSAKVALRGKIDSPPKYDNGKLINIPSMVVDHVLPKCSALEGISYVTIWCSLASRGQSELFQEIKLWHDRTKQLGVPIAFDKSIGEAALRSMRMDWNVPSLAFKTLGKFEATLLSNSSLVPRTDADAQAWLEWSQWNSIGGYLSLLQIQKKADELRLLFPHHRPVPKEPSELVKLAKEKPDDPKSRSLLAPYDLGLWS